jgi:hypothetical protein
MRFIVDLYRWIILGFFALALILLSVLTGFALFGQHSLGLITPYVIVTVVCSLGILVLTLGLIAVLISIHDRHAELVEQATRIADAVAGNPIHSENRQ